MRVAIQMDPLTAISTDGDNSILMAYEASKRGYQVWHYTPDMLSCASDGRISARARPFAVHSYWENVEYTLGDLEEIDLGTMDVVLLRQDPPFDMAYITTTFILEALARKPDGPLVLNDPASVRNHPEKWFPLEFPDLVLPTLISRDMESLRRFREEQGEIVLKPLYSYGGRSVLHIPKEDRNFSSLLEMFFVQSKEPVIAQKYISPLAQHGKRVVILDDYIAPGMINEPMGGEIRSNYRINHVQHKTTLSGDQLAIAQRLVPELQKRGLFFVAIDMIDNYILEINLTSPGGIGGISKLYDLDLGKMFWDKIEAKLH